MPIGHLKHKNMKYEIVRRLINKKNTIKQTKNQIK
jgi:hypothetical protein